MSMIETQLDEITPRNICRAVKNRSSSLLNPFQGDEVHFQKYLFFSTRRKVTAAANPELFSHIESL